MAVNFFRTIALLLALGLNAGAQSVIIFIDPPVTNAAGLFLYHGPTSRNYTNRVPLSVTNRVEWPVTGRQFFALSALGEDLLHETAMSEEIEYDPGFSPIFFVTISEPVWVTNAIPVTPPQSAAPVKCGLVRYWLNDSIDGPRSSVTVAVPLGGAHIFSGAELIGFTNAIPKAYTALQYTPAQPAPMQGPPMPRPTVLPKAPAP